MERIPCAPAVRDDSKTGEPMNGLKPGNLADCHTINHFIKVHGPLFKSAVYSLKP